MGVNGQQVGSQTGQRWSGRVNARVVQTDSGHAQVRYKYPDLSFSSHFYFSASLSNLLFLSLVHQTHRWNLGIPGSDEFPGANHYRPPLIREPNSQYVCSHSLRYLRPKSRSSNPPLNPRLKENSKIHSFFLVIECSLVVQRCQTVTDGQ